jgi:hypothetical protein
MRSDIIAWLCQGDPSIIYQVNRDLYQKEDSVLCVLRKDISIEGWGKQLLSLQKEDGHWGFGYYQPKWTSTHYTLLMLKNLGIEPRKSLVKICEVVLDEEKGRDGGMSPTAHRIHSDCCITGMFLNISAYFGVDQQRIESLIDYLITMQLPDGGYNCRHPRYKVNHASFHTTICVLEGLWEYEVQGFAYRVNEVIAARKRAEEFLLMHHLFLSDKDGRVIDQHFLALHYPCHWHYDVFRALEYFAMTKHTFDPRLISALKWLSTKENDRKYPLSPKYPGIMHFQLEKSGKYSRMNTLRAYRILRSWNILEELGDLE